MNTYSFKAYLHVYMYIWEKPWSFLFRSIRFRVQGLCGLWPLCLGPMAGEQLRDVPASAGGLFDCGSRGFRP